MKQGLYFLVIMLYWAPKATAISTIILCPDKYEPRKWCVMPEELPDDLIKSDTSFRFVPGFKMKPNQVLRFENVSYISLRPVGARANMSCVKENALIFQNVVDPKIMNIQFIGCGASANDSIVLLNYSHVACCGQCCLQSWNFWIFRQ